MNWNLAFWSFAFVVMTTLVILAFRAIGFAKRGDADRHRRLIQIAGFVVVGFVVSYAVKVVSLGREDKSDWTTADLVVLYSHEALVGVMLLSAALGAILGRRLYRLRAEGVALPPSKRNIHGLIGRTCAAAATLAWATGAVVLYRMIARTLAS